MEEIQLTNWDVENILKKNTVNSGINYQPQLVQAGFPPSTALLVSGIGNDFWSTDYGGSCKKVVGSILSPNWQYIPLIYQVYSLPSFGGLMESLPPITRTVRIIRWSERLAILSHQGKSLAKREGVGRGRGVPVEVGLGEKLCHVCTHHWGGKRTCFFCWFHVFF